MEFKQAFFLGEFFISPIEHTITDECGVKHALQPKFIEVLTYLAAHYPRVVPREELIAHIWEGNQYVGDKALTNAIWNLRQRLNADKQSVIETIRKSGYKLLIAPVFNPIEPVKEKVSIAKLSNTKMIAALVGLVCMVAILMVYFVNESQPSYTITTLTKEPGRELFPVVSHNQQYLVYAWRKNNKQSDLYLKDLSQPDLAPRQLTFSKDLEKASVWGSDDKTLYFVRKSWDHATCYIVRLELSTARETNINSCVSSGNIYLALTADGSTLAFTSYDETDGTGIYFKQLHDIKAPALRFSCRGKCDHVDRDISFSPDGLYAAVSRRTDASNEDIFLINLQNKETQQLTFNEGDIKGMSWTRNSQHVVYGARNHYHGSGFIVDINTKQVKSLDVDGFSYPETIQGTDSVVYHNMRIIYYLSQLSLDDGISVTPFPLIQSSFSHTSPHYSDVRQRITYVSNETGFTEVWSAKQDGSDRKILTKLQGYVEAPQWSHDGNKIVFLGRVNSQQKGKIFVLDVKTLSVDELKTSFHSFSRPTWSMNDQSIIVSASNDKLTQLLKIPVDGSKPQVIADVSARLAVELPNGNVLFTQGRGEGLWMIESFEKANAIQLISGSEFRSSYNWVSSPQGVYFQFDHQDHHRINYFNFASKRIESLVKIPKKSIKRLGSMTYIDQPKKLVFTQFNQPQTDVKKLTHSLFK